MADAAPEIAELGLRYRNLEDQQRDRDREHAVAERLDPAGAPTIAHVEAASTAATADPARRSAGRPVATAPWARKRECYYTPVSVWIFPALTAFVRVS